MEEAGKVRLVRCPKCENLLPELADFSVYQCGGCGAVLRAKNKGPGVEALSEKSDEERGERVSRKSDRLSEIGVVNTVDASDAVMKSDILKNGPSSLEKEEPMQERYKNLSTDAADKWVSEGDHNVDKYRNGLGGVDMRTEVKEVKPLYESAGPSRRPGWASDWRNGVRSEMAGLRNSMNDEAVRFSNLRYPNEGSSSYQTGLPFGHTEQKKISNELEASSKADYTEQERAELLRKLDELKDQLSRSCGMADKPRERAPLDRKSGPQQSFGTPDNWFPDGSSMPNRDPMQFPLPRERISEPPYFNNYPFPHRPEMVMPKYYPSARSSNHFHAYGDPYEPQLQRRAMHQVPSQYHEPPRSYVSGQYLDGDMKPFEPYPYNSAFHHHSCTCYHCYTIRQHVTPPIPPTAFQDRRLQDVANDPIFYNRENLPLYAPPAYNPHPLSSHGSLPHMRVTSDLNSVEGSLLQARPQRVVVASNGSRCYPIAGGAPFITCCNCFELLHLPEKVLNMDKNKQNLRCGACSALITYSVLDKKLVLSVNEEKKQTFVEADDSSSEMVRGKGPHYGHMNHASYYFNDYDTSGYEVQSLDREPAVISNGQVSNSSKPQEMQSFHSSSPSSSDDEKSPHDSIPTRKENNSSEQPVKATLSPPLAGSPLQEYFDYSNYKNAANRLGKGNRSSRSDHENVVMNKPTTRQNSVKEASVATEMDMSYNEFSNTGVSQDSGDGSREYDRPRVNKGRQSILANLIKKSFSKSNQANDNADANVSVNGHPIPDRVVKKAEKLAGPIRPGDYWYDVRAGFWGVMGGPCLGIIMPNIEEFNYPISEDCSGGDTRVFVNGRELHHKDLDLLAGRGLPPEKDRGYIVDISGRVWDEDTGEELDCLGKLAPTVEKARHGFGMKVPKTSA